MSTVVLYCAEPTELKLGPGAASEAIVFSKGFATFDSKDFPEWESWVNHPGTPHIEVLPADTAQVPEGEGIPCPVCDRTFKNDFGLKGHLRSHAPKA